jgi:hypothetical protein
MFALKQTPNNWTEVQLICLGVDPRKHKWRSGESEAEKREMPMKSALINRLPQCTMSSIHFRGIT